MSIRVAVLILFVLLLSGLYINSMMVLKQQSPPPEWPERSKPSVIADGERIVAKYQCTFCHVVTATEPHDLTAEDLAVVEDPVSNCGYCHILPEHGPETDSVVVRFLAPNFYTLGNHLKPEWMRSMLENPVHVRPWLKEEMPKFEFEEGEIDILVDYLMEIATPVEPTGDIAFLERRTDQAEHEKLLKDGKQYARRAMCLHCHEFTGANKLAHTKNPNPRNYLTDVASVTPDLRLARERLTKSSIVGLILDPKSYDPLGFDDEHYGVTEEKAETIAYYILHADITKYEIPEFAVWDEVDIYENPDYAEDVLPLFRRHCLACHYAQFSPMMGWGVGSRGGFGFPAKNFDLKIGADLITLRDYSAYDSWRSVMRGASTDGKDFYRVILNRPGENYEASSLLLRLKNKQYPKMPFGSKIPADAIDVIETWLKNGANPPADEAGLVGRIAIYKGEQYRIIGHPDDDEDKLFLEDPDTYEDFEVSIKEDGITLVPEEDEKND